ncbi:hypothetical protein, partial [Klebsiella pneumoniae]|uniref:hypothetical protein n=1 Tax=Klebsiella pneumoniae TaxID=573 RepID=UPI003857AA41
LASVYHLAPVVFFRAETRVGSDRESVSGGGIRMILYLKIATDIPAGTAITTRYIMDKYKVSRSTSRNALAVLAHIGAAEEVSRIHTEGTAYSLSPDAADKAQK